VNGKTGSNNRVVKMPSRCSVVALLAFVFMLSVTDSFASGPSADGQKILGKAPVKYGTGKKVRRTHNEAAIVTKIWAPGLDDKFVPQGLTWSSPYVLVAGYIWDGRKDDSEAVECRVYRIDPATGESRGWFTMGPIEQGALCRHAGGLACDGQGILYVSDTRHVFKIDIEKAFTLGSAFNNEALLARVALGGSGNDAIVGSFAAWKKKASPLEKAAMLLKTRGVAGVSAVHAFAPNVRNVDGKSPFGGRQIIVTANSDEAVERPATVAVKAGIGVNAPPAPGTLWLGRYTEGEDREKNTRVYEIPAELIAWADRDGANQPGKPDLGRNVRTLTAANASTSLWISAGAQGAAFDREGYLWISRTVTRHFEKTSVLHKKDPSTGDIVAKYEILHGLEDLAFDDKGYLWVVSESGCWKYRNWKVFSGFRLVDDFYPLLIRIDVSRLQNYD